MHAAAIEPQPDKHNRTVAFKCPHIGTLWGLLCCKLWNVQSSLLKIAPSPEISEWLAGCFDIAQSIYLGQIPFAEFNLQKLGGGRCWCYSGYLRSLVSFLLRNNYRITADANAGGISWVVLRFGLLSLFHVRSVGKTKREAVVLYREERKCDFKESESYGSAVRRKSLVSADLVQQRSLAMSTAYTRSVVERSKLQLYEYISGGQPYPVLEPSYSVKQTLPS